MYEIITYGGGEILRDVFNGIAMMSGMSTYLSAIKIAFTVGVFFTLFKVAFGYSFKENVKFIAGFMLIYNMIFLPKADIKITDRINPNLVGATVDNVPYGLALFASLTSRIGDKLTTLAEQNYSLPNDLQYHKNGMLMGSKLVDMSTDFYVTNSEFAKNLREYSKQCVFYDILLGKYSFDDLKNSSKIWTLVSNNPSPARSFTYSQNGNESIVTCQFGTGLLTSYWPKEIDETSKTLAQRIFPKSTTSIVAKNKLLSMLPVSYDYLLNISQSSLDIIQQNMMINTLEDATVDFANSTGANSMGSVYAQIKAEAQLRSASNVTAQLASKWVPLLKIVFECLFYGAFPFVFLLMLLPNGFDIFKNYFTSFMWLQSWGILYAILHRVMMASASSSGIAVSTLMTGTNALTLANQSGIQAINSDIATVAGYLSMSIPFFSMALVKGANTIAGMSDSLLNVPQSVASQTSAEVTSGNINLGNASIGNKSYANLSANKQDAEAYVNSGGFRMKGIDGSMSTLHENGSMTFNHQGIASNFLANVNGNQAISSQLSSEASRMRQTGMSLSTQASQSRGQAYSAMAQHISSQSINNSGNESWRSGTNGRTSDAFSNIQNSSKKFAETHGLNEQLAGEILASASAGISFGKFKIKKLPMINAGGSIGGNIKYNDINSQIYNDAKEFAKSEQLQESFDIASTAGKSQGYTFTDSKGNSLNHSINSNLNESLNLEQRASSNFSLSDSLNSRASDIRSGAISVSTNLNKEFQDYSMQQIGLDGKPLSFEKFSKIMKSDSVARDKLINRFVDMKSEQIITDYKGQMGVNKSQLRNDYNKADNYIKSNMDNKIDNKFINSADTINEGYSKGTSNSSIDTQKLKQEVEDQIANNKNKISQVEINQDAMTQVKDKHDESIKKSILNILDND
jgi:conjugal transfer mating pair stabilization protein TraG